VLRPARSGVLFFATFFWTSKRKLILNAKKFERLNQRDEPPPANVKYAVTPFLTNN